MNHIVYYNGERVFPEHVSNIGFSIDIITKKSKYICKCGSIFQNRPSSMTIHKQSAKHRYYFRKNLLLKDIEMFDLYRI